MVKVQHEVERERVFFVEYGISIHATDVMFVKLMKERNLRRKGACSLYEITLFRECMN